MIDIVDFNENGMQVYDTEVERAANILSIQVGSLEYAQSLGIDLKYFLAQDIRFQNDSFKSYLIEVLANNVINVADVAEVIENLYTNYTINITPKESSTGLIAR